VTEIARPLARLGLTYFTFDRHYNDNSRICLTNSGKWIEHYWRSGLYKEAVFEKDPMNFFNGYVFWDWLKREPIYSAAAEHDIDHGITLTEVCEEYSDFYHFGTNCKAQMSHGNIMQLMEAIYRFIAHFKQKTGKLISKAATEKELFPVYGIEKRLIGPSDLNEKVNKGDLSEFLRSTEITKLFLGEKFSNRYLTKKEVVVIASLIESGTLQNASESVGLSRNTFDFHINNIKNKFDCKTLFQLGCKIGAISERNIYPFKIY
jgi:DNA-binding CsgD family transcriptional regulator